MIPPQAVPTPLLALLPQLAFARGVYLANFACAAKQARKNGGIKKPQRFGRRLLPEARSAAAPRLPPPQPPAALR